MSAMGSWRGDSDVGRLIQMGDLDELVEAAREAFTRVHRTVFVGEPAANPRLPVDVLGAAMVVDTPTLVLLTPWTLNGLFILPDQSTPEVLTVAGRARPVFAADLEPLGPYLSVNLVSDVSAWHSPEQGRLIARSFVAPFRAAVQQLRSGGPAAEPSAPSSAQP
jgi:[NiFe]-hydrogenase assembly, chaperone, HybE